MEYLIKFKRKKEKKKVLDEERNQAIWRGEWKHYTITESNERKCARFTSEEKTHETIWMGEFPKDGSVSSSLCPFSYQGKVNIPLRPPCLAFAICGRRCMANWCVATLQSLGVLIDRAHFCAWTVYNEAECLHSLHDPVFKNFEQCHKSSNFWKTRNPLTSC